MTGNDILLPDSNFYSIKGRYINLVAEGYGKSSMARDLIPTGVASQDILIEELFVNNGNFPKLINEPNIFSYIIGFIYTVFGYSTIWVRIFNICISILSVFLLFDISRRLFGKLAANLFLIVALFVPPQFVYSVTLSRDFLRVFIVSAIIWVLFTGGDLWTRRLKQQF